MILQPAGGGHPGGRRAGGHPGGRRTISLMAVGNGHTFLRHGLWGEAKRGGREDVSIINTAPVLILVLWAVGLLGFYSTVELEPDLALYEYSMLHVTCAGILYISGLDSFSTPF
jgi:hypothetical protein